MRYARLGIWFFKKLLHESVQKGTGTKKNTFYVSLHEVCHEIEYSDYNHFKILRLLDPPTGEWTQNAIKFTSTIIRKKYFLNA